MEAFLSGHVEAFDRWGGVPKAVLYANLKSAVVERHGEAIRFNPTLLAFAAHYRWRCAMQRLRGPDRPWKEDKGVMAFLNAI